jgi:hypothetical protein
MSAMVRVLQQVTSHIGVHSPLVEGKQMAGVPKHFGV